MALYALRDSFSGALSSFWPPPGPQRGHDLLLAAPAEHKEQERVFVELLAQDVVDGSHMFARIRPIGAAALCVQLARPRGEEAHTRDGKDIFDGLGHLAVEQLRGIERLGSQRLENRVPLAVIQRIQPDRHLVGRQPGPLNARLDLPPFLLDLQHLPLPRHRCGRDSSAQGPPAAPGP